MVNYHDDEAIQESSLEILIQLGFEQAGEWVIPQATLKYSLKRHVAEKNILYAFISRRDILYIGKSVKTLNQRMYQYQNPGVSQKTNIRNHQNIRQILETGETIQIFVFTPLEQLHYRGFAVNIAAGLEDTLIDAVKPIWNLRGV